MDKNNFIDVSALPMDTEKLQAIIVDLSRRLQNSAHTIEAQKRIAQAATTSAEAYRDRLGEVSRLLKLEISKNTAAQRKRLKEDEALNYETHKRTTDKLHEDLRLAMIDHAISGYTREPLAVVRLRKKVAEMELKQDSQKLLLQHLGQLDCIAEDLACAAQHGDVDACASLIRKGGDVNEMDSAGYCPIHYACQGGHIKVVILLLQFGSDVTSYLTGHSCIEICARNGFTEIIDQLVMFGGNVNDKGSNQVPPIIAASVNNHGSCVDRLIALGANVNACDSNQNTALHLAAIAGAPMALGVEGGPSVDTGGAILPEDIVVGMIRLLLYHNISPSARNSQGQTALQAAMALSNMAAVEALGGRKQHRNASDGDVLPDDGSDFCSEYSSTTGYTRESGVPAGDDDLDSYLKRNEGIGQGGTKQPTGLSKTMPSKLAASGATADTRKASNVRRVPGGVGASTGRGMSSNSSVVSDITQPR